MTFMAAEANFKTAAKPIMVVMPFMAADANF
jgi:hypothetical protein